MNNYLSFIASFYSSISASQVEFQGDINPDSVKRDSFHLLRLGAGLTAKIRVYEYNVSPKNTMLFGLAIKAKTSFFRNSPIRVYINLCFNVEYVFANSFNISAMFGVGHMMQAFHSSNRTLYKDTDNSFKVNNSLFVFLSLELIRSVGICVDVNLFEKTYNPPLLEVKYHTWFIGPSFTLY